MGTQSIARAVCAVALLALAGCANLGAIRDFAAISSDSAGYTALTNEYASAPTRLKKYTLRDDEAQRQTFDRQAAERQPQVQKLLLYHAAVSSYMKALADLSADEVASFDPQIEGLAAQALAAKYIDAKEAGTISALGSAIAGAATDAYRQRKLKEVVGDANAPLQEALSTMDVLTQAYVASLQTEDAFVARYYNRLAGMAKLDKQSMLTEQAWSTGQAEQERVATRIRTAEGYRDTLAKIAKGHQALYEQRDQVSRKEVQRQLRQYANRIRDAYKAIRDNG